MAYKDDRGMYELTDDLMQREVAGCVGVSDLVRNTPVVDLQRMTTYGELTVKSFSQMIIPLLQLGDDDVFYDMGCGTAKPVLQVALETTCRVAKGVELFARRVEIGKTALVRLDWRCFVPRSWRSSLFASSRGTS
jgi:hypothetical protein